MNGPQSRPDGGGLNRKGRPPLTDRRELLGAARELGFRDLTVGAVMSHVDRKYSTFYRHFRSLEEIRHALAVDVFDVVAWPAPGPWRAHLAALADALTDVTVRWPGLTDTLAEMQHEPAVVADARGRATELLVAAGFDPDDAVGGVDAAMFAATGTPGTVRDDDQAREAVAARVGLVLDGLAARHPGGAT